MSPRPFQIAVIAGALVVAARTHASPAHPTRAGETGFVEVPSADVIGVPGALFGTELRLDSISGSRTSFGPYPVYGVAGVTENIEVGFSVRQWGEPGDELPHRTSIGTAAKLKLSQGEGLFPSLACDAVFDSLNVRPVGAARLVGSADLAPFLRAGAFAGAEFGLGRGTKTGATAGFALAAALMRDGEAIGEATWSPRGRNLGLAGRWRYRPTVTLQLGFNYLPDDSGFRVSLGVAITPRAPRVEHTPPVTPAGAATEAAPTNAVGDPPRFRMRMAFASPDRLDEVRPLQHGPWVSTRTGAARAPAPVLGSAPAASAPSLDDLAEAQLREQEALADARERRVRSASEQLEARSKGADEGASKLAAREPELAALERELIARQARVSSKGPPTQQQRQLESLEAQLSSQERQLAAQERSFVPAIEAAVGRERSAGLRESSERQEAARLAAAASAEPSRTQQLEIRKQALGARTRQLAALEAQLVAKGERIDAVERQQRALTERLDAWTRRLATRAERLELFEKGSGEPRPIPAVTPRPGGAAAAKEKAVFVMVVKTPTAVVKERGGAAAAQPAPGLPGVSVEKAVAAATVVTFASQTGALSELDRDSIDNIAKLAAREQCEVLIWARAKEPGLMADAERRAAEIKARVVAIGPLPEARTTTRITVRPGARGVDVVVSAMRETARPTAAPAPGRPSTARALETGEGGKRQLRDAVVAAQPSIEACVGEFLEPQRRVRAEGILKLTVSAQGVTLKVATSGSDLASETVDACLAAASASWSFPTADGEYVVEFPITFLRGGTGR